MHDTPPSSDRLAEVYDKRFHQVIVIYPFVWKHKPNGDWFLYYIIPEEYLNKR